MFTDQTPLKLLLLLLLLLSELNPPPDSAPRLNISDSDMLTITDGDEVTTQILGRFVGGSSPFKLSSSTPDLTLSFHSDPAGLVFGKGEGFIINYMGENQNQNLTTSKLRLLSLTTASRHQFDLQVVVVLLGTEERAAG